MQGKVIHFSEEKGYGFIYTEEHDENIFVHHSNISNASLLEKGQSVEFKIKKGAKGLSAVSVIAGSKQYSPYFIFGLISTIATIAIALYLTQETKTIFAYLIAINITTFLLYGYDKFISSSNMLRVPEWNLHALALLGGSPAGLSAQKIFRHKTIKGSFQLIYWIIVLLQIGLVYLLR